MIRRKRGKTDISRLYHIVFFSKFHFLYIHIEIIMLNQVVKIQWDTADKIYHDSSVILVTRINVVCNSKSVQIHYWSVAIWNFIIPNYQGGLYMWHISFVSLASSKGTSHIQSKAWSSWLLHLYYQIAIYFSVTLLCKKPQGSMC